VAVRLRHLEEVLATIERLIDSEDSGVLYRRVKPAFGREQRSQMEALIVAIRGAVGAVADELHLSRDEQRSRQRIIGLLATAWQSLGEVDARHLAGYGAVDPELTRVIDPALERIAGLVLALQRVAAEPPSEPNELSEAEPSQL